MAHRLPNTQPYDPCDTPLKTGNTTHTPVNRATITDRAMATPSAQTPSTPSGSGSGAAAGDPGQKHALRRSKGERIKAALPLIPAALGIAFAVLNLNQVKVDWIVGSGHAPLIIVIAISVLVGIVFTHLAERVGRKRR
jgi:uncharacterized integral membrane protein